MGKQKKFFQKIGEENIDFFDNGKIKVKKGKNLNLKKSIKESIRGTKIKYSKDIANREGMKNLISAQSSSPVIRYRVMNNEMRKVLRRKDQDPYFSAISVFSGDSREDQSSSVVNKDIPNIETVVITVNEKDFKEFNYLSDSVRGDLLRATTFGAIYPEVKNVWKKMIKNNRSHDLVIMSIPDVILIRDLIKKKLPIFKHPKTINVILIYVPSRSEVSKILPDESAYYSFLSKRIHHSLIDLNNHYYVTMDLSSLFRKVSEEGEKVFFETAINIRRFFLNFATILYFVNGSDSLQGFLNRKFDEKSKEIFRSGIYPENRDKNKDKKLIIKEESDLEKDKEEDKPVKDYSDSTNESDIGKDGDLTIYTDEQLNTSDDLEDEEDDLV